MANRLSKTPTAVYVAEVTPIPARPAFCVTQAVLTGYTGGTPASTTPGQMVYAPSQPVGNYGGALTEGSWVFIPDNIQGGGETQSGGVRGGALTGQKRSSVLNPRYQNVTTCYPGFPGRPGSPARVDYQANTGWNAGARSVNPVPTFGEFSGVVPNTVVATQLGLARRTFDHTYAAMTHSLVLRQGEWSVVERGITKAKGVMPIAPKVAVRREAQAVTYWINDNQVYSSDVPVAGETFGAALLYSLADAVDSPAIIPLAQIIRFSGQAPHWRALIADRPVAGVNAETPPFVLFAQLSRVRGVSQFSAETPAAVGLASDRPLALVQGRTPRVRLRASLGFAERIPTQMLAVLPPPVVSINLRSGGIATVKAQAPATRGLVSDRAVAYVKASAPLTAILLAGAPYMPAREYDGMDTLIAADSAQTDVALLMLAYDSLAAGASATLSLVLELSTTDAVRVASASTFGQLVELLAMDTVAVFSSTSSARHQAIQYAVNAISGAPTSYVGFDFSSFATVGGVTYGMRADGLYRIGDSLDNGETIDALIDFGTSDFGSAQVKRMEAAYLGLRTDGQCYLRVRADAGAERVYRVRGGDNVRKSMLAKGLAARSWSLALEVADASFAEVDSLELLVGATQRRGSGYRTR